MKMFLVLVSCLALSAVAHAQEPQGSPPAKKKGQAVQTSQHGTGPSGHAVGAAGGPQQHAVTPTGKPTGVGIGRSTYPSKPKTTTTKTASGLPFARSKQGATTASARTATGGTKTFTPQRFNLASKSKPSAAKAPAVSFKQGAHIQGSQHWTGTSYTAFRTYTPVWHDSFWWRNHHDRIVFVFGGWYFWNAGYWYPAWGYDPYAYYFYDGPIYAYNDLPPDQVIANVQASLQQQGYYQGEVDGLLGPLTRAAIARYQQDHGLYITSAIDEPTLAALGMV